MKNILLITLSLFIFLSISAQTNESNASLYIWKKKKTEHQNGYVVLKSGKRLEGTISLKGAKENVIGIQFIGDGKEIDFPITALNAYGLNISGGSSHNGNKNIVNTASVICETDPKLFVWRDQGEVMGKKITNTKPQNGYIIKRDGSRIEGKLQLKKTDGILSQIRITSAVGKLKLKTPEVASYGLLMTVNELTKNGEKTYKDKAKNFETGSVHLKNGEVLNGLVAFRKREYLDQNKTWKGYKYQGFFFAENSNSTVKTYSNNEIEYITHAQLKYSPYDGGFISETELDNVSFVNKLKEFNTGILTLKNGNKLEGAVALVNKESARIKLPNGTIKLYQVNEINRFDVMVEGEKKAVINNDELLTEELFNGKTFWVYKNPRPTHINQFKTDMAGGALSLGTSATSATIISKDAKKHGYETNLDSVILNSSAERLEEIRGAFLKLQGYKTSQELQDRSSNESAKKYDTALSLAIAGKKARDSVKVYYNEYVLINKNTNERYILYKKKKEVNAQLEGLLKGCYTFLSLEKKAQKQYYDLDNLTKTVTILDECY